MNSNTTVTVLSNNGETKNKKGKVIYNQCMWISISDYLRTQKGIDIPVYELREKANLTYHTQNSLWDEDKHWAIEGLKTICTLYDLTVEIYYLELVEESDESELIIHPDWIINNKPTPRKIIGEGKNKVLIGNYNEHFELLLKSKILESDILRF